jgi:hypothetical protein
MWNTTPANPAATPPEFASAARLARSPLSSPAAAHASQQPQVCIKKKKIKIKNKK